MFILSCGIISMFGDISNMIFLTRGQKRPACFLLKTPRLPPDTDTDPQNHPFLLNHFIIMRNMISIRPSAAGYPYFQPSSGMYTKFMP